MPVRDRSDKAAQIHGIQAFASLLKLPGLLVRIGTNIARSNGSYALNVFKKINR
jgi:hypothetical protein